jgi:hypothetical protein
VQSVVLAHEEHWFCVHSCPVPQLPTVRQFPATQLPAMHNWPCPYAVAHHASPVAFSVQATQVQVSSRKPSAPPPSVQAAPSWQPLLLLPRELEVPSEDEVSVLLADVAWELEAADVEETLPLLAPPMEDDTAPEEELEDDDEELEEDAVSAPGMAALGHPSRASGKPRTTRRRFFMACVSPEEKSPGSLGHRTRAKQKMRFRRTGREDATGPRPCACGGGQSTTTGTRSRAPG